MSSQAIFLGRVEIGSKVMAQSDLVWVVKSIVVDIGYDEDGHYDSVSDTWLRLESEDGNTTITLPYYQITKVLSS